MAEAGANIGDSLKAARGHVVDAAKAGADKVGGAYKALNAHVAEHGFRGAAQGFWKAHPVGAFALGAVATIGAVHVASNVFMGNNIRRELNSRENSQRTR